MQKRLDRLRKWLRSHLTVRNQGILFIVTIVFAALSIYDVVT